MPLHLLGKKSWNVYNPQNIERVKRDEAAAAAREEEQDRLLQEYDAARRLAILRGEEPPAPPPGLEPEPKKFRRRDESPSKSDRRKRRRLQGEDDTDRDIRLAQADREAAESARERLGAEGTDSQHRKSKTSDAPLHDHAGHIDLFPVDPRNNKVEKNAEAEKEKRRKERELEDQYTMRFSNAAGKDGVGRKPWYADGGGVQGADTATGEDTELASVESKDVWGREDLRRKDRERARINTGDPLAFMKKAQVQLRQSEGDKRKWQEERARDLDNIVGRREEEKRRERRKHRPEDREDTHGLEEFSLDVPALDRNRDVGTRETRRSRRNNEHQ
ncbi:hypothetical protein LTS18_005976, partial [Coniosporium uncinatum]